MKNGIPASALSEFVNEVRDQPEEANIHYGVKLDWESGTRMSAQPGTMNIGPHRVTRSFGWKVDEPRQLLGSNHGPNPQEYLLSGLGACLTVAFVAGATVRGIELDALSVEVEGDLDLHGFLGLASPNTIGFREIRYTVAVAADATGEQLESLRQTAEAHSPNAQTLAGGVALVGQICQMELA
jgi:uncharacterized OsmC-like protein